MKVNITVNILTRENVHAVHTDEDIITTELLKRRDVGNSGLFSEYFVRRIVVRTTDYDEEIPRSKYSVYFVVKSKKITVTN